MTWRTRLRSFSATALLIVFTILSRTDANAQARESIESFYDARFPRDCAGKPISSELRERLKADLRSQVNRVNAAITSIGVLDIKCAKSADGRVMGAVVLAYGASDLDKAYSEFQKAGPATIEHLLENEQYGVFQYDANLQNRIKTLKTFRSQRWRDYNASIELTSTTHLIVRASGSYGDSAITEEINLVW